VEVVDGDTVIGLQLSPGLSPPLAPASLVMDDVTLVHLDALVDEIDGVTRFRTEEHPRVPLRGQTVGLQQWWTPDAFDAVTDLTRSWVRESAPEPKAHEHCILGSEDIEQGVGDGTGWRSGDTWICCSCYERYIVEDHLRVRHNP
jgi:hypothetical protein